MPDNTFNTGISYPYYTKDAFQDEELSVRKIEIWWGQGDFFSTVC